MEIRTLQVGMIGTNCYLVSENGVTVVVDPGDQPERIRAAVNGTPAAILLTHGHYDHTGAVAALQKTWPGVPVYLSRKDQYEDRRLEELFPKVENALDLNEGDVLRFGDLKFDVLSTPGHSEGSVTFRIGDCLLCGDTLFAGSCGRTDFPGGSWQTILKSLRRLGELEGDLKVYPGHMESSTLNTERRRNPYLLEALGGAR